MTIIQSTPSGICITDEQGLFEYVNPAFCMIYGYQLDELIGKHFTIVVPESHKSWLIELHNKFIAGSNEVRGEWPVRNQNGEELFILADAVRIAGMDGRPKKVTFVVDITARKKVEDELGKSEALLREAVATKDKFISIIAHDLKNSFQVITGGAELLIMTKDRLTPEVTLSRAKMMHQVSSSALDLLNNLLIWAQSQTGSLISRPKKLNLAAAVGQAMRPFVETAQEKNILMAVDVPDILSVYADPNMLNTILHNLLGNAMKFTDRGNSVTISALEEGSELGVTVCDTGIGMDQETLEGLFHPDSKQSRKGTEGEPGTGLGLLICKEFVALNGGRIWAQSTLGEGSTFSFSLAKGESPKEENKAFSVSSTT
jgi:two-component system, sensor histidine kinase and response regulator